MLSKRSKKIFSSLVLTGILMAQMNGTVTFANEINSGDINIVESGNMDIEKLAVMERIASPNGVANFGRGSAQIIINGHTSQTLVGKSFNVYKLFDAQNAVGLESINYTLNNTYAPALRNIVGVKLNKTPSTVTEYEIIDYIQSLNNNVVEGAHANQNLEGRYSDFRYFVEEVRNEIVRLGITGDVVDVTSTRADNSLLISGLDFGYYILDEVSKTPGSHSASSLCMVNTANPSAEVQIKSDYPTVIKKILEDDNADGSIPDNGWNDIGDYEIGQTVPYKFESNVPNMNGYNTYYYAWHDVMDKALTFDNKSVGIDISDGVKTYTLRQSEFNVVEKPGAGETFKVEIVNLKAIVDREFNSMNTLGENVYGQNVTLRFDATLNDNAADDTGRPGFENDVKLEFSNNPDGNGVGETGETPWDTVVCFTYRIDGLKTNDHATSLEGAKFRLYSDKNLKNEVYLKESPNGYIVINRDSVGGDDHIGGSIPSDAVEMVSNASGIFNIIGLDRGIYYLKEVGAPTGYRPLLDPIEINIIPTYTKDRDSYVKGDGSTDKTLQTLETTAKIKSFYSGVFNTDNLNLTTNVSNGSTNLTVVNKVGTKLPVTGSGSTILMIMFGTGLMSYSLAKKKKQK